MIKRIWFQTGQLEEFRRNEINFYEPRAMPGRGCHPKIAVNDRDQFLVVWEHWITPIIHYRVGRILDPKDRSYNNIIAWGDVHTLTHGKCPAIVINNHGNVVIAYESPILGYYGTHYLTGTIAADKGTILAADTEQTLFPKGAHELSLAINGDDVLVAIGRIAGNFIYRIGKLNDRSKVIWSREEIFNGMNSCHPSIAITNKGKIILVQQSASEEAVSYRFGA